MLCVEVISSICLDWIYLAHAGNLVPTVYVAWGVGQPASGNALCHVWFEMEADSSPKHHVMLADCNCTSNLRPVFEVLISTNTDEANSLLWGTCLQADDGDTVNLRGRYGFFMGRHDTDIWKSRKIKTDIWDRWSFTLKIKSGPKF